MTVLQTKPAPNKEQQSCRSTVPWSREVTKERTPQWQGGLPGPG